MNTIVALERDDDGRVIAGTLRLDSLISEDRRDPLFFDWDPDEGVMRWRYGEPPRRFEEKIERQD